MAKRESRNAHETEDDGRVIADMSGLPGRGFPAAQLHRHWRSPERSVGKIEALQNEVGAENSKNDRPWEDSWLSGRERRWYILGAMKAGVLIALAFIVGLGLVILLLMLLWM